MSCCGGNCGCGSDCKCGSGCNGCKMYPDLGEESFATSQTVVLGVVATQKGFVAAGFEAAATENGGCNCKCGDNCTCNPCNCK